MASSRWLGAYMYPHFGGSKDQSPGVGRHKISNGALNVNWWIFESVGSYYGQYMYITTTQTLRPGISNGPTLRFVYTTPQTPTLDKAVTHIMSNRAHISFFISFTLSGVALPVPLSAKSQFPLPSSLFLRLSLPLSLIAPRIF